MKRIIIYSLWILAVILIIVSMFFARHLYQNRVCDNVKIQIDYGNGFYESEQFITYEDIQEFINQGFNKLKGNKIKDINIERLELQISKMAFVLTADASVDLDGTVNIFIKQRRPLIRILNFRGENYYIDETGTLLPGRTGYSARVVSANGFVGDSLFNKEKTCLKTNDSLLHKTVLGKLYQIAMAIDKDTFLRQEIVQIYVNEKHEFEMIPLVGDHLILFGNAGDINDKFWKLKQFYTKGIYMGGWDKYKTINLKYKDQIVCTKKLYNYGIQ